MSRVSAISNQLTVPTYVTLVRLCVAPLVLPALFAFFLPYNNIAINGSILALFILFSLTDLIDGFLARHYYQESELGKALDPIADKFLFYSCFIGLLAADKIFFLWVIIFIGRDLFMMGLRQIALQYTFDIAVSSWGKIRTVVVMSYIGALVLNPYQQVPFTEAPWWHGVEYLLLVVSLFLTVWSAYRYYTVFVQEFAKRFGKSSGE
jgi:CDP-diacylglycerol---glycerol-3-phosphate 3-phosphatidyltransferase